MDRYHGSSHQGYLDRKKGPEWLSTEELLSRFRRESRGVREYQEYMHGQIEEEVEEYYGKQYYRPVLGGKEFVQWVMEKVGGRVEEEKPESRRVFGVGLEEIVRMTARYYGKTVGEIKKRRRGEENEGRVMAMCLCRKLGGVQVRGDRADDGGGKVFDGKFGVFGDGGEDKKGSASGTKGQAE